MSRNLASSLSENNSVFLERAFALVCEVISRALHIIPYDVQIEAGLSMVNEDIVELPTGEGKTIVALFPAYIKALGRKGVHIFTFNDFLAKRDCLWMKPVYDMLGISVDFITENKTSKERHAAYSADVTYVTVKEAGYDYLRSFLNYNSDFIVQRPTYCAIVDEADSIMLDNARVPIILTGESSCKVSFDRRAGELVSTLRENIHYEIDRFSNTVTLTESGYDFCERELNINLSDSIELLSDIYISLKANFLLKKDINYIVKESIIFIIDEFTGRIMKDCRWSDGIQAALELKEGLGVKTAETLMNRITIESFLKLYDSLCGMTGTAKSSEDEFRQFYNKKVVQVPPNTPCIRVDNFDLIYKDKQTKLNAILKKVKEVHSSGRPVLIGTGSIRKSEELASLLIKEIPHLQILNAKNDDMEAAIIENAGKLYSVTISTNMAGRGVDIKLGGKNKEQYEKIIALGGLYVIATNRHDSVRIDNQLRGRAGRQGDTGESVSLISIEDKIFTEHNIKSILPKYIPENSEELISGKFIDRAITHIQKTVEGQSCQAKMSLSKYSMLFEEQRKIIYRLRDDVLFDKIALAKIEDVFPLNVLNSIAKSELLSTLKTITLFSVNNYWTNHLYFTEDALAEIRVMGKSASDPLDFYNNKIITEFNKYKERISANIRDICRNIVIEDNHVNLEKMGVKISTSTKTYMLLGGTEELNLVDEIAAVSNPISASLYIFQLIALYFIRKVKGQDKGIK